MPQQLTADYLIRVGEQIPLVIDYAPDIQGDGGSDTIDTSAWTVFTGITQVTTSTTDTTATLWIIGATANARGLVTNTLTTEGGKILKRSYVVRVIA